MRRAVDIVNNNFLETADEVFERGFPQCGGFGGCSIAWKTPRPGWRETNQHPCRRPPILLMLLNYFIVLSVSC